MKKIIILILILLFFPINATAKNHIDVAFNIDNNYPLYTLLAINSILINNQSNSDYTFWIIENNVSMWNKFQMEIFVKSRKQKIKFIHINTNKIDGGKNLYKRTPYSSHVSRIGTARIYIPTLLPKNIHKVLYLDSDILVISDIKKLYDTDIDSYAVAMAKNNSEHFRRQNDHSPTYYNSGVILINMDYWRSNNIEHKMTDSIKNNQYNFPDQDAINFVLRGKIKELSQIWNNQIVIYNMPILTQTNDGGIIHYIGVPKPWQVMDKIPEVELYYKYWCKSYLIIYICPQQLINLKDKYLNYHRRTVKNIYLQFCKQIINKIQNYFVANN